MAKGKCGADSSVPVTTQIDGKDLVTLAQELFNETPVFWGRYFTSVSAAGDVEYRHLRENRLLRQNSIHLLPIARQTKRVNGTRADGSGDAEQNVEDLIATFGKDYLGTQGGRFFMFLDVEGSPSLSAAYYLGWAQTVVSHSGEMTNGAVTVLPCVYATQSDTSTWQAIVSAADNGASCSGVWVARWRHHGCAGLDDWDDDLVKPNVAIRCPVLLWQYSDDCHGGNGFDCNQTNPGIDLQADLLDHLILPPDTEV